MADIKYEIKETVGVIAESAKGWKKELNLISQNGKEAKYANLKRSLDFKYNYGTRDFLSVYNFLYRD